MKKFVVIILFVLLLTGCGQQVDDELMNDIDKDIRRYVIMEDDNGDEYKIYYYGVDNAIITVGEDNFDFEQAILTGTLSLEQILNDMELVGNLNDGGTKIYRNNDSRKYFDNSYTIIVCNTVDGNHDIYIGDNTMGMEDGFCKFKISDAQLKLSDEVEKMKITNKIIIRNMNDNKILKTITDSDLIDDVISMISNSTEMTLPVTTEGTNIIVQMFDSNDKLITYIYVWKSGYFGFEWGKDYFIDKSDIKVFDNLLKI